MRAGGPCVHQRWWKAACLRSWRRLFRRSRGGLRLRRRRRQVRAASHRRLAQLNAQHEGVEVSTAVAAETNLVINSVKGLGVAVASFSNSKATLLAQETRHDTA